MSDQPTTYDPATAVFSYGGTTPKAERERYALDEFCKRMRRCHRASLLPVLDAVARGLVLSVDGSTVDGVVKTSTGHAAVELLSYSPLSDRGDVMERDFAFRTAAKAVMYKALAARSCSLLVGYRDQIRKSKKRPVTRTVPATKDFHDVIRQLQSLLEQVPAVGQGEFLSLRFTNADLARRLGHRGGNLYLDEAAYRDCSKHFSRVRLQGISTRSTPHVDSDLSGGGIGFDDAWVKEHLIDKARRSLMQSRARANGLPLWLLVHSDGHANHQTISMRHREQAVALCRETLKSNAHGFERAYWADRTGYLNGAWVGRIL